MTRTGQTRRTSGKRTRAGREAPGPLARHLLGQVVLLAALAAPGAVQASPFCVTTMAVPPQCIYADASECQKEAARQGGECDANPDETRINSAGLGTYCTITSGGASSCVYQDLGSCNAAAVRMGGACVRAPIKLAPYAAPDPYRQIRP